MVSLTIQNREASESREISYPSLLLKEGKEVARYFEDSYVNETFKFFLAQKVTVPDIVKFFHKAQKTGADPVMEQIYLIPRQVNVGRNGKDEWRTVGTVVFSYHFVEEKAQQSKEYQGYTEKSGKGLYFDPATGQEKEMLFYHVTVKRNGHEYPYTAWYDEYVQTNRYGQPTQAWKKPYTMLRKCALAGALRAAFPEWLSGVYAKEEFGSISRDEDESIQAEFTMSSEAEKREETMERLEEKALKAENMDEVELLVSSIQKSMGDLCVSMTVAEKGKFMRDTLGVSKFTEVKSKSLDELRLKDNDLKNLIKETELREIEKAKIKSNASKKNEKPSFIIEEV